MGLRVAFVEWPDGLLPEGPQWDGLRRTVDAAGADLLITNEMPFGPWLAAATRFDPAAAARSVELHERGLAALAGLQVPAVLSSRPLDDGGRLANEAFLLAGGAVAPLHRKHFFPAEEGWHEAAWFRPGPAGFGTQRAGGATLGALLCTEVMFNEFARAYGRDGADIIAVPRATGDDHPLWSTACAMAAIVSGTYVVSSNRIGRAESGPVFGGRGMAFAPDGSLIAHTTPDRPLAVVEADLGLARRQKGEYPCYVAGP